MKKEEYFPLELKSVTLHNFLFKLDNHLFNMESHIDQLEQKLDDANKTIFKMNHETFLASNKMMADILTATIDIPKAETVGPVGAIALATIMSMKPNKEIKEYITSIANTLDKKEDKDADISEG